MAVALRRFARGRRMTKGSVRGLAVLCAVAAVAIAVPRTAEAQAQPARSTTSVGGYMNIHAGMAWPAEATFTNSGEVAFGSSVDTVRASYPLTSGFGFEIGGGVVINRRWIVGAAYSFAGSNKAGELTVEFTHPPTHGLISDTAPTATFDRQENSLHIQGGVLLEMGKMEVMLFGGPSRIAVSQLAVYDLVATEALVGADWVATITNAFSSPQSAAAWGFNVGGDVSYAVNERVSIGAQVRYSRATVNMEDRIASLAATFINEEFTQVMKDSTAGGVAVTGGLRIRF